MKPDPAALLHDLAAEHAALDARVADLTEEQWRTPTPADSVFVTFSTFRSRVMMYWLR